MNKSTAQNEVQHSWRYKPSDPTVPTNMNVFVTKTFVGEQYRLEVSFAVPSAHLQYELISIYGYRMYGRDKKMRGALHDLSPADY